MFYFVCCSSCGFSFLPKIHSFSRNCQTSFAILIHLVYVTDFNVCDRLKGYQDTDIASLILD